MLVRDVFDAMQRLAPLSLGEDWDNVGVLAGDPDLPADRPVLLTIDLTAAVVEEAVQRDVSCIIAYHPPIFRPIRGITTTSREGRTLLRLLGRERPIPVFSPHTALDAAPGGLADWLLDAATAAAGQSERRPIVPAPRADAAGSSKLVVFVPQENVERVADAIAAAGAGVIGDYTRCTFRLLGEGTFLGGAGANPAIGEAGRLERVAEIRLEAVCPGDRLAAIVEALRTAHPYEEPAFDVFARAAAPDAHVGAGRIGVLAAPLEPRAVAERLRAALGVRSVRLATAPDGPAEVTRIGVCPGSGGSLLETAGDACELFVTGEMSHHAVLAAVDRGTHVLLAGHTNTERPYLPVLRERLRAEGVAVEIAIAEADRWPLEEIAGGG